MRQPRFDRMNIAAGGTVHDALTQHRVLQARLREMTFVIAHADDRERAFAAAQLARADDDTDVYTVLLTDSDLRAAADDVDRRDVTVYDAQRDNRPSRLPIKVNGQTVIVLPTEHGYVAVSVALASDIHAGDIFTTGNLSYAAGELTVYRALADADPDTGSVQLHIVTRTWDTASAADRENLTFPFTPGPNRLVHRVVNRLEFLAALGLRDLADSVR